MPSWFGKWEKSSSAPTDRSKLRDNNHFAWLLLCTLPTQVHVSCLLCNAEKSVPRASKWVDNNTTPNLFTWFKTLKRKFMYVQIEPFALWIKSLFFKQLLWPMPSWFGKWEKSSSAPTDRSKLRDNNHFAWLLLCTLPTQVHVSCLLCNAEKSVPRASKWVDNNTTPNLFTWFKTLKRKFMYVQIEPFALWIKSLFFKQLLWPMPSWFGKWEKSSSAPTDRSKLRDNNHFAWLLLCTLPTQVHVSCLLCNAEKSVPRASKWVDNNTTPNLFTWFKTLKRKFMYLLSNYFFSLEYHNKTSHWSAMNDIFTTN